MNKFDLQKNQALKLAGQLKQAGTPDRYGSASNAPDRREQARLLLALNPDVDPDYLERRIREESMGDYGIADIED